jgi:outer membrane protein W
MTKKVLVLAALVASVSARSALAQDQRVEASVTVGWTFSDGVSGQSVLAGDGKIYDRLDPKDSFRWGLDVGVYTTENVQVGFMWNQQMSALVANGPAAERELGDMNVNQYHGYFAYNMGDSDAKIRPYFLFGLGATQFGTVDIDPVCCPGTRLTTKSNAQFSTTWGAGVKMMGGPHVGARAGIMWTPTYIKTDASGYWCDPYWGCYLVGDAQYSNAWDFGGGIIFKF